MKLLRKPLEKAGRFLATSLLWLLSLQIRTTSGLRRSVGWGDLPSNLTSYKIHVYYGDVRQSLNNSNIICQKLTTKSNFFPMPITLLRRSLSPPTILSIQGMAPQRSRTGISRSIKRCWNPTRRYPMKICQPRNISGCFGTVVLDEHLLRNLSTRQSEAVAWLNADFHLLLTAPRYIQGKRFFFWVSTILSASSHR